MRTTQTYINQIKKEAIQKQKVDLVATYQLPQPVVYKPGSYIGSATKMKELAKGSEANPLVIYPLKALQFVGILTQNKQTFAYIMAPDNMIYKVKSGDLIGDKYGKITKIDSDHIEISEKETTGKNSAERIVSMGLKD
jgi:type IV pilus assembly protein PilP